MSVHSDKRSARAAPRPPADPERRHAILTAARDAFSQKGFHRTTIRDIAQRAGLAEGTLYNHFKNKDDLLIGLFETLGAQTRAKLTQSGSAGSVPTRAEILTAPLRALAEDNFALFRIVISEALIRPELGRRFMSLLRDQARLGQAELESPPAEHTIEVLVMGLALQRALCHEAPAPDPSAVADDLSQHLLALGLHAS